MASGGDAARARRRAQRRNAANVRSGQYKPQFRAETSRARAAATRVEQQRRRPPIDQGPRDAASLRAAVKAKKRRVVGDDFKYKGEASDRAVDKFPVPESRYLRILNMSDAELQEFYESNGAWDNYKFLFYH